MNKVLIVVTSSGLDPTRIYDGSDEWLDGWGFEHTRVIALRQKSEADVRYLNALDDVVEQARNGDCIVWVRGKGESSFEHESFNKAVERLLEISEVYLKYHDPFFKGIVSSRNIRGLVRFGIYTLSKNALRGQSSSMTATRDGHTYLNRMADFDALFRFFFLVPREDIPWIKHKINGALACVDLDLQGLSERGFEQDYWEAVLGSYEGRGLGKLEHCRDVLYGKDRSLRKLFKETPKADLDPDLDSAWTYLSELLPETESPTPTPESHPLYLEVREVLTGLDEGNKEKVKGNFDERSGQSGAFRRWLVEIDNTIDRIGKGILNQPSEPMVGARS